VATPNAELITDVSPRVHELMQRLDRQPPGTYIIYLEKPEVKAVDWKYEIVKTERVERGEIAKTYRPE